MDHSQAMGFYHNISTVTGGGLNNINAKQSIAKQHMDKSTMPLAVDDDDNLSESGSFSSSTSGGGVGERLSTVVEQKKMTNKRMHSEQAASTGDELTQEDLDDGKAIPNHSMTHYSSKSDSN